MDAERWERAQSIFHDALEVSAAERSALVAARCEGDVILQAEVEALLAADERSSLLDRGVAETAHEVFGVEAQTLELGSYGAYRVKDVLGEGGMGIVYLAERADLGSRAAIKILRDAWLSPARRERFAVEQRTLAQLTHPSIARLYDAGTLPDGTPWFVMEYVEGVPITDYCRERAATVPERLRLLREVCEAVQHAHRHLVIHRDLKPSNVLVQGDGSVKLLDFGIAKQLDSTDAPMDQTRTMVRLMTPAYAAPEQIRGERVGLHTDVYALGVMLYELLVGRLPFELSGHSPAQVESILLEREPEKPSTAAARMALAAAGTSHIRSTSRAQWADLDVLCLTAMQKDPQRRYRTVEALIRDIDHYLGGQPLEARPDSRTYRLRKFMGRNWRPVSAAALVSALIVGLVSFYTFHLAAARNAAVAQSVRTERIQQFMLNLFSGGDDYAGPSDSLRVVTLVDRGVQEARLLDAEPQVQTKLLQTLGGIFQKLGKLERADSLLTVALDRSRAAPAEGRLDLADNLVAIGLLRSEQAKYDDADRAIRQALDIRRTELGPGHTSVIEATEALGHVMVQRGKYDDAIPVLEEVVQLRAAAAADTPELADALYELASVHFYAGHLPIADSLNQQVLAIYRARYGERHPLVADALINLGAVQHEQGHYEQAVQLYRKALDITRGWHGDDHPKTAANLTMVARSLIFQEKYEEAAQLLRQSLVIRERVFGKDHPSVASTVNELGTVAIYRKQYDEAKAAYRRMIDIYRKAYAGHHYYIGVAISNLASVYMAQEQHATAEPLFREALAMYASTLSPDHMFVGVARIKLGRTLLRQRRYAEAERETLGGYEVVSKQADPTVSWLVRAREDLVEVYSALGKPELADKYRATATAP